MKSLNVLRRHLLIGVNVTGPRPEKPPAAVIASMNCSGDVWSETSEKMLPPGVPFGEGILTYSSGYSRWSGIGGARWWTPGTERAHATYRQALRMDLAGRR